MHDNYLHWHCFIDYCVKLILINKNLCKKLLLFHTEMISVLSFGEMCFLEESYKWMKKTQNFEIFWERPQYEIWECAFKSAGCL